MRCIKSIFTAIIPALFIAGVVGAATTLSQNIVTEGDLTVGGSVGIGKTSGIDDTLSIFGTLGLAPDATSSPDVRLQRGGAGNLQFIGAHTISTTAGNLTLNPSGGQTDVTGDLNTTGSYLGDGSKLSGVSTFISEGLISYWRFEGNLLDAGFTQDLSLGAGTETYIDFPLGQALDFDGSTYYVANDADYDFEKTDSLSIEFWFKSSNSGGTHPIVAKLSSSVVGYSVSIGTDDKLVWQLVGSSGGNRITLKSTNTYVDGVWHHVVATYDGSEDVSGLNLYIDGTEEGVDDTNALTSSILNNVTLKIGKWDLGNNFLTGQLSHVRIYNSELTAKQAETLFDIR